MPKRTSSGTRLAWWSGSRGQLAVCESTAGRQEGGGGRREPPPSLPPPGCPRALSRPDPPSSVLQLTSPGARVLAHSGRLRRSVTYRPAIMRLGRPRVVTAVFGPVVVAVLLFWERRRPPPRLRFRPSLGGGSKPWAGPPPRSGEVLPPEGGIFAKRVARLCRPAHGASCAA